MGSTLLSISSMSPPAWPSKPFALKPFAFLGLDSANCTHAGCMIARGQKPAETLAGGADESEVPMTDSQRRCVALGSIIRLLAWIVHGLLDGSLIGGATSLQTLISLSFAIGVCAIQDVAAFSIFLTERKCTPKEIGSMVLAFSLTFPAGTIVSLAAADALNGSAAWDSIRCAIAGLFVYMALFELAPPHSHSPVVVCLYTLAFCLGLFCAYSGEFIEDLSVGAHAYGCGGGSIPKL